MGKEKIKKTIVLLIVASLALVLVTSALPMSAGICAATDGDQQGEGGAEVLQKNLKKPQKQQDMAQKYIRTGAERDQNSLQWISKNPKKRVEIPQKYIIKKSVSQAVNQNTLHFAPLNPDFVAYFENPPEVFFGEVPPPMDFSHLEELPVRGPQPSDTLPSSFDWRDYGKVTPVKDQNPCGTCWDFAATSALESTVLMEESVAYIFSEQSVALCVDRSWVYLYDASDEPCGIIPGHGGGNCWLASEVFIKKGSVLESCNPYNTSALNCDGSCVCDDCAPVKKVDGFRVAAWDGSQVDTIKNAIYSKGPAKVSYKHNNAYVYLDLTWGTIHDYYPCSGGTNHAVSVVGWDDSVPHPNPGHTGTGAWIIKNSWGTDWGNDGFFYLAYNSSCAAKIIQLEYKDPVPGEELLYWDEAGEVSAAIWNWTANVFTAPQSKNLTHVDFWTTSSNAQYEIYVWDNFFGTELAHQTGNCPEVGYYSIPLSAPISMDAGQQFTVGVNMTTPGYKYPIPIEYKITGTVDPPIQLNVSFVRYNTSDPWTDLGVYGANACLRARLQAKEQVAPIELFNETGIFKGGFEKIQDAVNNASSGYTILVHDGTYNENVDVNIANLTIQSENGSASTTVQASNPNDHVFNVTANSVNISGFTVTEATGAEKAGIYIENGIKYCNITNNTVKSNDYGFYLSNADNNNITCNWVHHNAKRGFYLTGGSTGNNISLNNIIANGEDQFNGAYQYQFANNQSNNIVVTNNWWGTIKNDTINDSIWDWQDDDNWGNVTFRPKFNDKSPCAPIPELETLILSSVGLLVLTGYVYVERKKREE